YVNASAPTRRVSRLNAPVTQAADGDARTLLVEFLRCGYPDPAFAAGDKDILVREPTHCRSSSLPVPWAVRGLHLCEAAVHRQLRSRDVAAVVGCEKHDGPGDLIGRAEPAERSGA